jgi:hypothetical protein
MLLIDFTIMLIFLFYNIFFMPLVDEDGRNNGSNNNNKNEKSRDLWLLRALSNVSFFNFLCFRRKGRLTSRLCIYFNASQIIQWEFKMLKCICLKIRCRDIFQDKINFPKDRLFCGRKFRSLFKQDTCVSWSII